MSAVASGLDGLVVAQTSLSSVDGTNGILKYRGYNVDDLVNKVTFEEIAYLIWYGALPTRTQLDELNAKLAARRAMPGNMKEIISSLPTTGAPIDSLKIGVTVLAMLDEDADNWEHDALVDKAISATALFPTVLAAYERHRKGKEILAPQPDLSTAGNFLYMVNGTRPSDTMTAAFDTYLMLLAEHSMNASTFTARSTISSSTDYYSATNSAIGSLKGIAHGGANILEFD